MPRRITISKGLDLPISGKPKQSVQEIADVRRVAILARDYIGMKPTMMVTEGDIVKVGQPLFEDKKTPGVLFTAPAAGKVVEINRGAKRKLLSVVIEVEGDDKVAFPSYTEDHLTQLDRATVEENLIQSGLWTAFRTRPYGKVPAPGTSPRSIFVTAMDTNPLAAEAAPIIKGSEIEFIAGLEAISTLTEGKVHVCQAPGAALPGEGLDFVDAVEFEGKHPAGLPGTHIHFLDSAGPGRVVWYLGYQDVIAIGHLFRTGELDPMRVISLAGPGVKEPRLLKVRLGSSIEDLTKDQLTEGPMRKVSGSVLCGYQSEGVEAYLGRYHNQVSVLGEGGHREMLGWLAPGFKKFSVKSVFASFFSPGELPMTATANGSHRAIVPIEVYETVMPLDIEPTALMKSLIVEDTDSAQALGALELEEEDVALCTFVDTGKHDFGTILRKNLTRIEAEG
ncbi:Na(+)-translocating NADH-quinone reductase subunit A [Bremerella cremea]|uniref:Na(+)-translocating NADH-quinone reductase subunit A n=1 Tax=Bremerella cremea TaxID=1031537 RepID=A0A368KRL8_9BACT|nr:Na(+)-translocating NADH-quinone reductase subunit A [Bremerella cremea]RCS49446.1 Na(+)-translocating NADH-quinone reductase subunit A [Bremerella cremea]